MSFGDLLQDKPKGKWPILWGSFTVLLVGGWIVADIIGSPVAWIAYLGGMFLLFWALEGPALANRTGGDTYTEYIQHALGNSGMAWLGFVIWFLVSALLFMQVSDLVAFGFSYKWTVLALTLFSAWLFKHFLWHDSRIWKWAALKKSRFIKRVLRK